tara:strand:- start:93 stop:302 length:210 start_codon:yes stop_codon:yes gene_type:complete
METYEQLKMFMTADEIREEYVPRMTPDWPEPTSDDAPIILAHQAKVVLDGTHKVASASADTLFPVLHEA